MNPSLLRRQHTMQARFLSLSHDLTDVHDASQLCNELLLISKCNAGDLVKIRERCESEVSDPVICDIMKHRSFDLGNMVKLLNDVILQVYSSAGMQCHGKDGGGVGNKSFGDALSTLKNVSVGKRSEMEDAWKRFLADGLQDETQSSFLSLQRNLSEIHGCLTCLQEYLSVIEIDSEASSYSSYSESSTDDDTSSCEETEDENVRHGQYSNKSEEESFHSEEEEETGEEEDSDTFQDDESDSYEEDDDGEDKEMDNKTKPIRMTPPQKKGVAVFKNVLRKGRRQARND